MTLTAQEINLPETETEQVYSKITQERKEQREQEAQLEKRRRKELQHACI